MEAGFFILLVLVVVALGIWAAAAAKKRREELAALAGRLGLRFDASDDRTLARRFGFLNRLAQGTNRYAYNVLSGSYQGSDVLAFDYHYETHTTDSKGRRQTHHDHFSFFICLLPAEFRELTISREGLFSKVAQAFGYDDIDFESAEFSRKFCVRCPDKKFAYDVCHSRMIEYLLANPDVSLEIEGPALALAFGSRLSAAQIEFNLERLMRIRSLLPNYLFTKA